MYSFRNDNDAYLWARMRRPCSIPLNMTTPAPVPPRSVLRTRPGTLRRGPWWLLFTDWKGVKYLNDQTHMCAWCNACIGELVRVHKEQDQLNIVSGALEQPRSIDDLEQLGKRISVYRVLVAYLGPQRSYERPDIGRSTVPQSVDSPA